MFLMLKKRLLFKTLTVLLLASVALEAALAAPLCSSAHPEGLIQLDPVLTDIVRTNGSSVLAYEKDKTKFKNYATIRNFHHYRMQFGEPFYKRILALRSGQAILDGGCGDAYLANYFFNDDLSLYRYVPPNSTLGPFPQRPMEDMPTYIGVTYATLTRTREEIEAMAPKDKLHLETGRFFEEIPNEQIVAGKQVMIVVDNLGIFSYSSRPDLVLKKYLEILDKDGALFLLDAGNVKIEGKDIVYWLERTPGLEVRRTLTDFLNSSQSVMVTFKKDVSVVRLPGLEMVGRPKPGIPPTLNFKRTSKVHVIQK